MSKGKLNKQDGVMSRRDYKELQSIPAASHFKKHMRMAEYVKDDYLNRIQNSRLEKGTFLKGYTSGDKSTTLDN